MNTPIFSDLSVVMLCFNDEACIAQAIEAILRQDLTPGEFIIVDDHSSDTSWKLIQSYAKRNACISAYQNDRNLGAAKNASYALELVKTRWFYAAASDDLCMPGTFSKVYKAAKENPDVGVITGAKFIEDPQQGTSCTISVRNWKAGLYSPKQALNEYFKVEHPEHSLSPSHFYRQDLYRKYGGYQEGLGVWGDTYLMRAAAWDSGLYYIDSPLTTFRVNPNGYSRTVNSNPQVMFDVLATAMRNFCSPDVSPCWPVDFIYSWWLGYRRAVLSRYIARLQNEHIKLSDELLKIKELNGGYSTASIDVNSIESAQQLINFWNEHYVGNILKSTAADFAFLKQLSAAKSYWETRTHINSNGFVKYVGNDDTLKNDLNETGVFHPFLNPSSEINNIDRYWVRKSILESIKASIPLLKGRFLDVGCGVMPYRELIAAENTAVTEYIGMDIETEVYKANVDLRWDGQQIPMEDNSVDSAMATEVLEHCPEPLIVLKEIRRVLKPGGTFFLTVPYIWPLHDAPWDFYRYTSFALEKMLAEAGFVDVQIRALGGWNASLAQMIGLWLKRAPVVLETKQELAKTLMPIYNQLINHDVLPDVHAGDTMVTGWSGVAYVADTEVKTEAIPATEIQAMDGLKLCIIRSHVNNYSETFIEDHISYIAQDVTVLYGYPNCHMIKGQGSIYSEDEQRSYSMLSEAQKKDLHQMALARFLKRAGISAVLMESGLMAALTYRACQTASVPYVVHFHGADVFMEKFRRDLSQEYSAMFSSGAGFVAVSEYMKRTLVDMGGLADRILVNPCGVEIPADQADPAVSAPVFVAVGRFVAKKAPLITIRAFAEVVAEVPTAKLFMAGDGPFLDASKELAKKLGLTDSVTFCGVCSRRIVKELLLQGRAFVQHSVTSPDGDQEGLPVGIMEAGAIGLPIISTNHSGIPEAVTNGVHGFLVNEGDIKAMAGAMLQLAQEPALAARMGQAFQIRVQGYYSRLLAITRLQELLQRAAQSPLSAIPAAEPKVALTLEEIDAQIGSASDAGLALDLGDQAAKLEDQGLAFQCYERAVAFDRGCGRAYLEMGIRLGQAGQYEDAYLCLKEAERAGALTESSSGLLRGLEANPELDSSEIKLYRARTEVASPVASEQPRRILVFTNILPPQEMGGYGRSIWELCEGLLLRGHTVRILTADVPDLAQAPYPNYERVEQYVTRNLKLFGDWQHGGARTMEDVGGIQEIVRHNARSIFQEIQDFQPDLCMAGNLDFLGAAMLAPILAQKIPIVHRLGNGAPGFIPADTPKSELYCIAGCSNWVNQELVRNGYQPSHFALLPPGSPLHEYYRFVVPRFDRLRICFAGLMMAYKGPHLIVEALGLLKKLGLVFTCEFAGNFKDPVYERQFKHLLMKHGVSKEVRLHGFCGRQQLADMFDRSNVLVMPSVFEEPFGKVQIEAQAAGLAVVRSPVGGYKDMLQDEVNGLLFKREDAQDLARQLFVLQGDVGLWQRLARQGQRDAFEYTTQRSVETLEGIFERLIARST